MGVCFMVSIIHASFTNKCHESRRTPSELALLHACFAVTSLTKTSSTVATTRQASTSPPLHMPQRPQQNPSEKAYTGLCHKCPCAQCSVTAINASEAAQVNSNISKHAADRSDLLATLTGSNRLLLSGRSAKLVLTAQKNVLKGKDHHAHSASDD